MNTQKSACTLSHLLHHFLLKHTVSTQHRLSCDISGAHISRDILDKTQQEPQQEKIHKKVLIFRK